MPRKSKKGRYFSPEHRAKISAAKRKIPPEVRFFAKVDKNGPGGCWLWTAGMKGEGYGAFDHRRAHQFSWELVNGPVPAGLQLDHLCRVRHCVNPEHLEAVTHQENIRRGQVGVVARERAAAQTHCKRGHLLQGDNLQAHPKLRRCKVCISANKRRIYHQNKQAINEHRRAVRRNKRSTQ